MTQRQGVRGTSPLSIKTPLTPLMTMAICLGSGQALAWEQNLPLKADITTLTAILHTYPHQRAGRSQRLTMSRRHCGRLLAPVLEEE